MMNKYVLLSVVAMAQVVGCVSKDTTIQAGPSSTGGTSGAGGSAGDGGGDTGGAGTGGGGAGNGGTSAGASGAGAGGEGATSGSAGTAGATGGTAAGGNGGSSGMGGSGGTAGAGGTSGGTAGVGGTGGTGGSAGSGGTSVFLSCKNSATTLDVDPLAPKQYFAAAFSPSVGRYLLVYAGQPATEWELRFALIDGAGAVVAAPQTSPGVNYLFGGSPTFVPETDSFSFLHITSNVPGEDPSVVIDAIGTDGTLTPKTFEFTPKYAYEANQTHHLAGAGAVLSSFAFLRGGGGTCSNGNFQGRYVGPAGGSPVQTCPWCGYGDLDTAASNDAFFVLSLYENYRLQRLPANGSMCDDISLTNVKLDPSSKIAWDGEKIVVVASDTTGLVYQRVALNGITTSEPIGSSSLKPLQVVSAGTRIGILAKDSANYYFGVRNQDGSESTPMSLVAPMKTLISEARLFWDGSDFVLFRLEPDDSTVEQIVMCKPL